MEFSIVGKSLPKRDGWSKALGEARFLSDLKLPGMLHGKILRSTHAHAWIRRLDVSRARELWGVRAVITIEDTPRIKWCWIPRFADRYILAAEKVRYVGEEVAAVAAVDEETAEEALSRIEVEYEPLPAVFTPEEALRPGAPILHGGESNVAIRVQRAFGDVNRGFAEADVVREDRFETTGVAHCCLEPRGCVADFSRTGKLTIWSTTQAPHTLREEVAQILGMDGKDIRVIQALMGGAFGGRMTMDMKEPIAALLSRISGRPVRIVNTRDEEFQTSRMRYPFTIDLKTGVKRDGSLTARQAKVTIENGAYNEKGLAIVSYAGYVAALLYRVPHIRYEGIAVYTNRLYGGAFRGFGNPQITFAIESQMDMLAEKIGLDPVEIRLRNSNRPQETTVSGGRITSCALPECIESAARSIGWRGMDGGKRPRVPGRGVGIGAALHTGAGHRLYHFNSARSFVSISEGGEVHVVTGASELGQGARTVLAQIAAEELGVHFEEVTVSVADTETTPVDLGAFGSRTTFVSGHAVKSAAAAARERLFRAAAELLEADPRDLEAAGGKIFVRGAPGKGIPVLDAVRRSYQQGIPVTGEGGFEDRYPPDLDPATGYGNFFPTYAFGAQAAEVEVDRETGVVRVLKVAAATDLGRAIHPASCEGQVEGALAQGIGFGLFEGLQWDGRGAITNASFTDYRLPRSTDMPQTEIRLIESIDPDGPFGAKGIGELALVPMAAAIANAIYDATGVRILSLPITPEKIRAALREGEGQEKGPKI